MDRHREIDENDLSCYHNNVGAGAAFTDAGKTTGGTAGTTYPVNGTYMLVDDTDKLYTTTVNFTIPAGSYAPTVIATLVTRKLYEQVSSSLHGPNHAVTAANVGSAGPLIMPLYMPATKPKASLLYPMYDTYDSIAIGDANQPIVQYAEGTGWSNPGSSDPQWAKWTGVRYVGAVGAQVVELEFNESSFEFSQFHTPPYSKTSYPTPGAWATYTTPAVYSVMPEAANSNAATQVGATSGCVITDLQPPSFWDSLGFTQEHCKTSVYFDYTEAMDTTKHATFIDREKYIKDRTTGQLVVFQDYVDRHGVGGVTSVSASVDASLSTATRKIEATTYTSEEDGYYLIEVESNLQTDFYNQDKRLASTASLASKQYNNADFVTSYAESSIPYQHVGASTLLSSLTLKIIDPGTQEPAVGLGTRSTVFVEVVKGNENIKKTQSK